MDAHEQRVEDWRAALIENTDSMNRLSAVLERNTMAVLWLCAVLQWYPRPWWKRGPEPKWPRRA